MDCMNSALTNMLPQFLKPVSNAFIGLRDQARPCHLIMYSKVS